jgi:hypothetical protein
MPRLVADQNPWHLNAARFCVGQGEHPSRFEWELRPGIFWAAVDGGWYFGLSDFCPTKRTRETRPALFATPVSFVRKGASSSSLPPGRRCHSLGTNYKFWSIRPRLKSTKNWSSDSHRSSRLHFEWIASGFTVLCFWIVPTLSLWVGSRLALEGPVRFILFLGLHTGPIESE